VTPALRRNNAAAALVAAAAFRCPAGSLTGRRRRGYVGGMSFQAYLDAIEDKTGRTPRELVDIANAKGFNAPGVKAGAIVDWLKEDYDLGRGHAMALVYVIQKGDTISEKHVGTDGVHRDESTKLHLDGKANR
jgi:hypothetical protein